MSKANVFLTYSHVDEAWKDRVAKSLADHTVNVWRDAGESPGRDRLERLEEKMQAANAAVFLVSESFLGSKIIQGVVVPVICERQKTRDLRIFPVLIEKCEWQEIAWIDGTGICSLDGEPLATGDRARVDEALTGLAADISSGYARDLPPPEDIFREHYQSVVSYFRRLGVPADECRDLAQETFKKAFNGMEDFERRAGVKTWLHKIARHTWYNRGRSQMAEKRRAIEISIDSRHDDEDGIPLSDKLENEGFSPEDQILAAERLGRLQEALSQLPPQRKQCLFLRIEGYKYREIAALMGISIQSVRSHLHQAREQLRELLGEDFDDRLLASKTEKT